VWSECGVCGVSVERVRTFPRDCSKQRPAPFPSVCVCVLDLSYCLLSFTDFTVLLPLLFKLVIFYLLFLDTLNIFNGN